MSAPLRLEFSPLARRVWIKNATIEASPHFVVSVSKGIGMWYVGEDDAYEVAIMARHPADAGKG